MKFLRFSFSVLAFFFEVLIPLILFGGVIPYTHNGIAAGLTKMGYLAITVFLFIIGKKLKEKLIERPKSLVRGLVLSLFPIAMWLVVNIFLGWIISFLGDLSAYWDKIIIFIAIGRLFYTVEEALAAEEIKNGKNK